MPQIREGDAAPEISAVSHSGRTLSLADLRERTVVLFFYPRDDTPVCTRQACAFRDSYVQFMDAGAVVIGVSGDSDESHREFAAAHNLPFEIISDAGGALRKAYGVPRMLGLLPGRATYVIDREGIVRMVFVAHLASDEHVRQALRAVRELAAAE